MEDVAQIAGVSRALVSLVMRDSPRVSDESRQRVTEAAAKLGYRPNLMARNLAARKTMTIGVLLNDLHNPWFAEVTDGIHAAAERHGYQLILASGRRSPRLESRALDTFLASRVDGIIVAGCRLSSARLEAVASEVALVSVGRAFTKVSFGSVTTDDAARRTTCRRTPPRTWPSPNRSHRRRQGRRRRAASSGLPAHDARPWPRRYMPR